MHTVMKNTKRVVAFDIETWELPKNGMPPMYKVLASAPSEQLLGRSEIDSWRERWLK